MDDLPRDSSTKTESQDIKTPESSNIKVEHIDIEQKDTNFKIEVPVPIESKYSTDYAGDRPYWPHLHSPEGRFWTINRVRTVTEAREAGMGFEQIAGYLATHPLFVGGKLPSEGKLRIVCCKATGRREG